MALSWSDMEKAVIWTCCVQRCGMTKAGAGTAVSAMAGDTVNLLLLPNPANQNEVFQCAVACHRKANGQTPFVLSLLELLGIS